jgi:hypothetical protein
VFRSYKGLAALDPLVDGYFASRAKQSALTPAVGESRPECARARKG